MATPEEIERRVQESDAARNAKRSATAKRVGELAQRRATIADQLGDVERELGDLLATAQDVIDVDELAQFTDIPVADLTHWLTATTNRKTTRAKPKRRVSEVSSTRKRRSPATTPTAGRGAPSPKLVVGQAGAAVESCTADESGTA
jgi:hypothetical protein